MKCVKNLQWPSENESLKKSKRICENCVNQFICKESDYQFKSKKVRRINKILLNSEYAIPLSNPVKLFSCEKALEITKEAKKILKNIYKGVIYSDTESVFIKKNKGGKKMSIAKLKTKQICVECGKDIKIGTLVWTTRVSGKYFTFMELRCALEYYNETYQKYIKAKAPKVLLDDLLDVIRRLKKALE